MNVIRYIEDVPADNMELTDVQLCTHGLIKLSKTGGLYANANERWNLKDRIIRQQWMEFKTHFVAEYKNILVANRGTAMDQEGYGTGGAYNAIEDNGSYLAESIVQYYGRATEAEGKVNELESRLAALEMPHPPNTTTHWILCPTNGIWNDAKRTYPTYLHPYPASIPTTATT